MDREVNKDEEHREYRPLSVLIYDLVEFILEHLVRDNCWEHLSGFLIIFLEVSNNVLLEFSDIGFLLILSVVQRAVPYSVNIQWEAELLERSHRLNSSSLLIDQGLVLDQ